MTGNGIYHSITTQNVNNLNYLIKICRIGSPTKTQNSATYCQQETQVFTD